MSTNSTSNTVFAYRAPEEMSNAGTSPSLPVLNTAARSTPTRRLQTPPPNSPADSLFSRSPAPSYTLTPAVWPTRDTATEQREISLINSPPPSYTLTPVVWPTEDAVATTFPNSPRISDEQDQPTCSTPPQSHSVTRDADTSTASGATIGDVLKALATNVLDNFEPLAFSSNSTIEALPNRSFNGHADAVTANIDLHQPVSDEKDQSTTTSFTNSVPIAPADASIYNGGSEASTSLDGNFNSTIHPPFNSTTETLPNENLDASSGAVTSNVFAASEASTAQDQLEEIAWNSAPVTYTHDGATTDPDTSTSAWPQAEAPSNFQDRTVDASYYDDTANGLNYENTMSAHSLGTQAEVTYNYPQYYLPVEDNFQVDTNNTSFNRPSYDVGLGVAHPKVPYHAGPSQALPPNYNSSINGNFQVPNMVYNAPRNQVNNDIRFNNTSSTQLHGNYNQQGPVIQLNRGQMPSSYITPFQPQAAMFAPQPMYQEVAGSSNLTQYSNIQLEVPSASAGRWSCLQTYTTQQGYQDIQNFKVQPSANGVPYLNYQGSAQIASSSSQPMMLIPQMPPMPFTVNNIVYQQPAVYPLSYYSIYNANIAAGVSIPPHPFQHPRISAANHHVSYRVQQTRTRTSDPATFKSIPGLYQQVGKKQWECRFHKPDGMCTQKIWDSRTLQRHIGTHAKWEGKEIEAGRMLLHNAIAIPNQEFMQWTCPYASCRFLEVKGYPYTVQDTRVDVHRSRHLRDYHPKEEQRDQGEDGEQDEQGEQGECDME